MFVAYTVKYAFLVHTRIFSHVYVLKETILYLSSIMSINCYLGCLSVIAFYCLCFVTIEQICIVTNITNNQTLKHTTLPRVLNCEVAK